MPSLPTDASTLAVELAPTINALEEGRMVTLNKIRSAWKKIGIATALALGIALIVFITSQGQSDSSNALVIIIPIAAIALIYSMVIYSQSIGGPTASYRSYYKSQIIGGMTRLIQPDIDYMPSRGLSESNFRSMNLYNGDIDRFHGEDLFTGKIGKTAITFSEVHAEDKRTRRNSKGKSETYWVTIFKGLAVIVDFNKHFRSWVTLHPDTAESSFGWLGRKLQQLGGDLVRLENPDFEQAFVVRGGDQVEARYLLTPEMQERLLNLRQHFGDGIRLAMHNSQLHLTIPNSNNWFEPDIRRPAGDPSQMQLFIQQMTSIFHIVELLDLNTRIWTKK
ncbi:DUF3137 domain-containing protein [Verrucomicrobiaceae bacterium N1E253]|uniref:DUF3137 domain-containing protein n=1 Tax=Oceaniferula marina TaxID=2748318 RepID=A0A851GDJ7_9BACT|nr:DUF3137 domain-containing protein [Oceaniferula marina]NWK55012.1 DUF3137 domain-containing protein [Oceaniferula marina]